MEETYGILSVIPPVLAIGLALVTKQVLLSLFLGIFIGVLILTGGNFLTTFLDTLAKWILGSVTDEWNAALLIFMIVLGGVCGILARSGGAKAVAEWVINRTKSVKNIQIATLLMGILIFIDDYINALIVGNTMRPITDRMKISREKLSFIVDATAAPVSTIGPITSWIGYQVGLMRDSFNELGIQSNAYVTFFKSIPYAFYSLFMLGFVLFIALQQRDFGPMYRAEVRARTTGKVVRDGGHPMVTEEMTNAEPPKGTPLRVYNFFIPILAVLIIAFIGMWYNGGGPEGASLQEAISNCDVSIALMWAAVATTIISIIMVVVQKIMSLEEAFEAWVNGAKSIMMAIFIAVLAWTLGDVCSELGTADYLVNLAKGNLPPYLIPAIIFLVCAAMSFATGTSWGTMAVVMPLAIPLAYHLGGAMLPTIASVLSGSVMGDHCSPISDTTVMSSLASASDHIDHVNTQIPYALTVSAVAVAVGYIPAGFGVSAYILLPVGLIGLWFILKFVGKPTDLESINQHTNIKHDAASASK